MRYRALPDFTKLWSGLPLRAKGLLVVAIPVAALFLALIASNFVSLQERQTESWVRHSYEVRGELRNILFALVDAETGLRGYTIRREREYLEPYERASSQLASSSGRLGPLLTDNPDQLARLQVLRRQVNAQLGGFEKIRRTVDQRTAKPGLREKLVWESKEDMDRLRAHLQTMLDSEDVLLRERLAEVTARKSSIRIVFGGGIVVGLAGSFLASLLFSSSITSRIVQLEENAHRLAANQPLLPPTEGDEVCRDEIGSLDRSLHEAFRLLEHRHQAQLAAEASLQRHMDNSLDVICSIDGDGNFLAVSSAALRVFGYEPSELVGKAYMDLVHPEDRETTIQAAADTMSGLPALDFENRYIRKDGSPVTISWTAAWDAGHGLMYCVARDISERKYAEAELQELNEALQEARKLADTANRAKSEFLSRMSHELRTPMNAILGFAQILEMERPLDRQQEPIEQILKGGHHLLHLINEVLDIARIESGRVNLSPEPVLVTEVMEECTALVAPLAMQRHITFNYTTDCGRHVRADRQRLKQVFLNLLSNAVKYNRDGGTVSFSCAVTRGGTVRMEVTDTGLGIHENDLERLFTPFERLNAVHSGVEGTGLGLALSQRLVEAMGGTMGAISTVGSGSTFWLELPLSQDPALQSEFLPQLDAPSLRLQAPKTVLYIEDNLSNLRLIERLMEVYPGVRLLTAMQASLGLELANLHHPDLILLDLHLPDMPGDELLRRLQAEPATAQIPVIMLSADASARQIERLISLGAREYLTKPLDVPRFLMVLEATLMP